MVKPSQSFFEIINGTMTSCPEIAVAVAVAAAVAVAYIEDYLSIIAELTRRNTPTTSIRN